MPQGIIVGQRRCKRLRLCSMFAMGNRLKNGCLAIAAQQSAGPHNGSSLHLRFTQKQACLLLQTSGTDGFAIQLEHTRETSMDLRNEVHRNAHSNTQIAHTTHRWQTTLSASLHAAAQPPAPAAAACVITQRRSAAAARPHAWPPARLLRQPAVHRLPCRSPLLWHRAWWATAAARQAPDVSFAWDRSICATAPGVGR